MKKTIVYLILGALVLLPVVGCASEGRSEAPMVRA
jgi:hypothetical protein